MSDLTSIAYPGLIGAGIAAAAYSLTSVSVAPVPSRGHLGAQRDRARRSWAFRLLEWPMRLIAAHVEQLGSKAAIARADERIAAAGDYLGLRGAELLALRFVGALVGLMTALMAARVGLGVVACTVIVGLGAWLAELSLRSARKEREKQIDRGLPDAIDLTAMCMGAGLDFPGALTQVVENFDSRSQLRLEIERVLQELSLGYTRRDALQNFAIRVPTDAVVEFVTACVQAEEKGTPLVEVLRVQAGSLRGRRSVRAEEAAARAGALMILPLMMLFGCILLVVLGPLILEMRGGGM